MPLIGRDLINGLELNIHGSPTLPTVNSDQSPQPMGTEDSAKGGPPCIISSVVASLDTQANYTGLLREFPTLTLDRLSSYPSFQHRIELKPDAIPIACHARPVLLALRNKVEDAVRELDRQGIWEPVEKSEWVL